MPNYDFIPAGTGDPDLKKNDRVVVKVPYDNPNRRMHYTGKIIGESRDGRAWMIIKDGTKWARGIHKSFVERAP